MTRSPAIAAAAALILSSCGQAASRDSSSTASSTPTLARALPQRLEASSPQRPGTGPEAVARNYALALRSWTAANYTHRYALALSLAGGRQAAALRRTRPTPQQLEALRVDGASARAVVVSTRPTRPNSQQRAEVEVVLNEVQQRAGADTQQQTRNLAELRRRSGRWTVDAFTVIP